LSVPSGTAAFRAVCFLNENTGYVVDEFGNVLKTTNGGANWSYSSPTMNPLYGVSFTDVDKGTVVGYGGCIFRTTNGGSNWSSQTSGVSVDLYTVSFTDANNGTAVGLSGTIIRTTDGGANWSSQTSGTTNHLLGVSFVNSNVGTVVGYGGTILRTTNGGSVWVSQTNPGFEYTAVHFVDANNGTAVGQSGKIVGTADGGTNWTEESSGISNDLLAVSFRDANNGIVGGTSGKILTTSNGVVPVELVSLTAILQESSVNIRWTTASETDCFGFDIERRRIEDFRFQMEDWKKVGFVCGSGTSTSMREYLFTDSKLDNGRYAYRLKQIDRNGDYKYYGSVEVEVGAPIEFGLSQNYPNPFNPTTAIRYSLVSPGSVSLKIYDALGREWAMLVNTMQEAGSYSVQCDARDMSSGVYFTVLEARSESGVVLKSMKKMLLVR
jgi:photosystem II stability/assembly factor-like uncharacterized protein